MQQLALTTSGGQGPQTAESRPARPDAPASKGGVFAALTSQLQGGTLAPGGVTGLETSALLPPGGKLLPADLAELAPDALSESPIAAALTPQPELQARLAVPNSLRANVSATLQADAGTDGRPLPDTLTQAGALPRPDALALARAATPAVAELRAAVDSVTPPSPAPSGDITTTPGFAAAQLAAASRADAPDALPVLDIDQPVGKPEWNQALGDRLTWMADNGVNRARLTLHPQHLGPIEVSVQVSNDEVSVSFTAHHAATRDAIETAMPRLREMMGELGLSLGQANVSQHSAGQGEGTLADSGASSGNSATGDAAHDEETMLESGATGPPRQGLIDTYA